VKSEKMNNFSVVVKNVLFDGANTKLLAIIENTSREIMAALPQDKRFDHIQPGDKLEVGVFDDACTCF
jgi:spermidine/putrescine transport system ATP-binding protein